MYELKWVRFIPFVIGFIFILYGCTQSMSTGGSTFINLANGDIESTIRAYVFIVGGLILIIIGVLMGGVLKYIYSMEERVYREMRDE